MGSPNIWCKVTKDTAVAAMNHKSKKVMAHELTLDDGRSSTYLMGVVGVTCDLMCLEDDPEPVYTLHCTLSLNGITVVAKVFASNEHGRCGRLLRETYAEIPGLSVREHKK